MNPENPEVPEYIVKIVESAKTQKEWSIKRLKHKQLPPTVVVERDCEILAKVIAPQVDRDMGIECLNLCKIGFNPDSLTFLMDAHFSTAPLGENLEEFKDKLKESSLAERKAAGDKDITECIVCYRISSNGSEDMAVIPYSFEKNKLVWLNDEFKSVSINLESKEKGNILEGYIPDALRQIMQQPTVTEQFPMVEQMAKKYFNYTSDRAQFHMARAICHIMSKRKFFVIDYFSVKHPEWIDFKIKAGIIIDTLIEKAVLPKEAKDSIFEVVENYGGTPNFKEKLIDLFNDYSYWLPNELSADILDFAVFFETEMLAPGKFLHSDDENPENPHHNSESKFGFPKSKKIRVKVWNGDKSEYLGEGTYVGNVKVYFIRMSDGSLRSNSDAEVEPTDIPVGGKVISSPNNPKIELDNGRAVYGCQVWWEEIKKPTNKYNTAKYNDEDL